MAIAYNNEKHKGQQQTAQLSTKSIVGVHVAPTMVGCREEEAAVFLVEVH